MEGVKGEGQELMCIMLSDLASIVIIVKKVKGFQYAASAVPIS